MSRSTVELPSGTVSYLTWTADRAAPTVVLLHGGGVDSASLSWGEIGPRLAQAGYRVIAPDHPGYGHSAPARLPVTQERLVAYVGELVDALGLGRYTIGGLSLGGGMTIGHVLDRPDRVSGAMLLGSYGVMPRLSDGPFSGVRQLVTWAALRTGLLGATTKWVGGNRRAMARSMHALITDPKQCTDALLDEVMAAAGKPGRFEAFEQWQRDQVKWNRLRTDYTGRLASVACPVLIVHGDRDPGVPVARARAAAALIPDADLKVIAGAGHWVQRDRPGAVLDAMTEFLAATATA
ncbi:alpha/beta fold hydrolase [Mycolicibacterium mageritense]|uniref:4,5:9,10-diseco-3-hydroxy-5,9, 17-trioxoandrosta-1(10),2-diene-4-oate hydrolase n=1 Tax=Mycolicibacterium mageritense TaxID=53462 RepID=A0AAI8XQI4_MYCME|nr:alpha/beta hydrolase [Mycolicibacterium mageritense]BDY31047.1 4,5:9,10-diseco-3-hydroxy-5,9, 17-trioxoandrosta-1(10),2-diene-4-oate hydrolase [Mycolicibacterium mageritense]